MRAEVRMHAEHPANPLLDFSGLPRLDAIRPEHVTPAIDLLVDAARNAIEVVAAKQRATANELRDFRLGGAELPQAQKARFKALEEELAELSARFDDNLLDATNAWALYVDDEAELLGVPRDVLAEARAAAAA